MANWQIVRVSNLPPVFADVWYADDDAGVDELCWIKKRKGKAPVPGARISDAVLDKWEKRNPYLTSDITEQHSEACAADYWEAKEQQAENRREQLLMDKEDF